MGRKKVRIGLVGYSRGKFNKKDARNLVEQGLQTAMHDLKAEDCELVSGLTNMGIPKLGYQYAKTLSLRTVGIAPSRARRVRSGLFPVDETIFIGKNFGDESDYFIEYIDILVRIGGGPQSRNEVKLFRAKYNDDQKELDQLLFELELEWLG